MYYYYDRSKTSRLLAFVVWLPGNTAVVVQEAVLVRLIDKMID